MESSVFESQLVVPPDFLNESSSTPTSGNLQLEPQVREGHSPEQFEQQDSGDETTNEFDLAEDEESNTQMHLSRIGNEGRSFCC